MLQPVTKQQVQKQVTTLDSIKHIDENGNEYWNAHELAKALGYKDYRNFKNAIERTRNALISAGKDPDERLVEVTESFTAN